MLILLFGPVSGAHFNPVVSLADWWLGRRSGTGSQRGEVAAYIVAQCLGARLRRGAGQRRCSRSTPGSRRPTRVGSGALVGEVVATAGLVLLIFALVAHRRGRALAAPAVGAYIGAAYWFTSSTSFANPAVTARPDVHRHLRRHRPVLGPGVRRRAARRRRRRRPAWSVALYPDATAQADAVVVPAA